MRLNKPNLNPTHHRQYQSEDGLDTDNAHAASAAAGAARSYEPSALRSRPNAGALGGHHGDEQ